MDTDGRTSCTSTAAAAATVATDVLVTSDDTSTVSMDHNASNLTVSLPLIQCQAQNLLQLKSRYTNTGECKGWQIIEGTAECFTLAKMKLKPTPQVIASLQIYRNFEYSTTMGDHKINLCDLGFSVGSSYVSCVNDLKMILDVIDSLHFCEGNLCEDFSEIVLHNKGIFYGTDRKFFLCTV